MKVAVVGLGIAGCFAAKLLAERGIRADLFEASHRIGGRAAPWENLTCSPSDELCASLGPITMLPPLTTEFLYDGQPVDLDALGEALDRVDLDADMRTLDLEAVPWENVLSGDVDATGLDLILRAQPLDADVQWALEALFRSELGANAEEISLLWWLGRQMRSGCPNPELERGQLPFTAPELCRRLLAVAPAPRMAMPLRRVERYGDDLSLLFDDFGDSYDRVILAVPPDALAEITFDPELSDELAGAIGLCGMAPEISLHASYPQSEGTRRVLVNKACGELLFAAGSVTGMIRGPGFESDEDAIQAFRDAVGAELADVQIHHGERSFGQKGYVLGGMHAWEQSDSRLIFAGEHTMIESGTLESALQSAARAVQLAVEA